MHLDIGEWAIEVEAALRRLDAFLKNHVWYGRENELVNLFAHAILLDDTPRRCVQHPTQVGIEVAVKQPDGHKGKALVRKDLVLWHRPYQTLWSGDTQRPVHDPAVIIEFKVNEQRRCDRDRDWLSAYTKSVAGHFPNVLGYAVCGFLRKNEDRGVSYSRVSHGRAEEPVRI